MNIKTRIQQLNQELVELRRKFHRYPELGFKEFQTQEQVMSYLQDLGLEVSKIAGTGVLALLRGGKPGKTVLLRSDMDALPVQEETELPFASEIEGMMHNPEVDGSFGLHLWSQTPSGTIDIVDGLQMAASHYFYLTIKGRGGHAGFAHESVDPIYAATNIVQSVQAVQTREINALNPAVVMFTEFHAGSNMTIVPEKVEMKGSIRFLYEGGEEILQRFERIIAHTCKAHRVSYELEFKVGNKLLSNDPASAELVRSAAAEVLGDRSKVTGIIRTMAGEDFCDYLQDAPGAFSFVGVKNPAAGSDYPHHHPKFNIDEKVLPIGVELHVRTALRFLKEAVKARRVADKLGSSVAPIYNNFETIDELVRAVVEHVLAISSSILAAQQDKSMFENIGRASLTFARMYPLLVRDLVLKPNPWIAANEQQDHTLVEMMAEDPALAGWSQAERRRLLLQMRAFQMGLMLMTANQQIPSWAADIDLEQLLMQTSHSLVQARNNQTHRSEE